MVVCKSLHCLQISLIVLLVLLGCLSTIDVSSAAEQEFYQDKALDKLLVRIQDAADEVRSFHCSFEQAKHMALFEQPVIFRGELYVERPDKLRWEFHTPVVSVLLFAGSSGMRCGELMDPVRFDLTSDPVMKSVAEQLWLWLSGKYNNLNTLYILQDAGPLAIQVIPKQDPVREVIKNVVVRFDASTLQPRQVEINEPDGDVTRMTFSNYTINPTFKDSVFVDCGGND